MNAEDNVDMPIENIFCKGCKGCFKSGGAGEGGVGLKFVIVTGVNACRVASNTICLGCSTCFFFRFVPYYQFTISNFVIEK